MSESLGTAAAPAELALNYAADRRDSRDRRYDPPQTILNLPERVDLRESAPLPPIHHQGNLNSCTAHAIGAVLYFDMHKQGWTNAFEPSRLFVYYNERHQESLLGDPRYRDHGAPVRMRDCIKSVNATGICREEHWPYQEDQFDTKPPDHAYEFAARHRALAYRRLEQDERQLKACLAAGHPFVCGIVVYQSFLSYAVRKTGVVPMPAEGETLRGGHAVAVVGYDDAQKCFIARNSFGAHWGDQGHCYLPYDFLCNPQFGLDFWTISSVGSEQRNP